MGRNGRLCGPPHTAVDPGSGDQVRGWLGQRVGLGRAQQDEVGGESVTATNVSYNAAISPGGSTSFGLQGTWTSNDTAPSGFTVNGTACT